MCGAMDRQFLSFSDVVLSSFLNIWQNQYCIFLSDDFLNPGTGVYAVVVEPARNIWFLNKE